VGRFHRHLGAIVTNTGRLLVLDFDYFFPTPTMAVDSSDVYLYDWDARESPFHIGLAWHFRAAAFIAQGLSLPRCNEGYTQFWDRFDLTTAAEPIIAADSNAYAGRTWPSTFGQAADAWSQVWLFDAHHDCYGAELDQAAWQRTGTFSCDTWMRCHHAEGSTLHVRYPRWRATPDGTLVDCEKPPAVPVDRQVDDEQPVPGPFDAVMVCRSGAWVPSWCDDQFEAFLAAAPIEALWVDEQIGLHGRYFDERIARRHSRGDADAQR
jgi:hypothetical protein